MTKMFYIIGIAISTAGSFFVDIYASKEVACKCANKTVQFPNCGICGSDSGKMEKAGNGISCFCENNLKFSEVSCEEVCADHGGWTGDIQTQ